MLFAIATSIDGRPTLVTPEKAFILRHGYTPEITENGVVIFTDVAEYARQNEIYLPQAVVGQKPTTINQYKALASKLDTELMAPLRTAAGAENPVKAIVSLIPAEYRRCDCVPASLKSKIFLKARVADSFGDKTNIVPIDVKDWTKLLLPLDITPIERIRKASLNGDRPGFYRCSILSNKESITSLLKPLGELWLTHHQLLAVREKANVVIHEGYKVSSTKKEAPISKHPMLTDLIATLGNHEIAMQYLRIILLNLTSLTVPGCPALMTTFLRSQMWVDAFDSAQELAAAGLTIIEYSHDKIVTE